MNLRPKLQAVLFDLDGTLLDTAPDMVGALNELRTEEKREPLDYGFARAHVSNGALGLLRIGFPAMDRAGEERLRQRFLEIYADRVSVATTVFPGMATLLGALDTSQVPWGVVTNKPANLTEPLLAALGLLRRCACVVSGDTLPERKPHPRPLLHAAERLGIAVERVMYVGDAARDIQAGKAAGMVTVAARYGYIQPGDDPAQWNADHEVHHPQHLHDLLVDTGALPDVDDDADS